MVVETLFNNLPVRRRELEKNIKREYSKALGVLNAYACISTGVRFAVSNTLQNGRKTVAFSTNSNLKTRDNIANVFGAKTLYALVPLDLKFDMEPTSNISYGQNSSRDRETKSVQIIGHISRPYFGEGRQTPDRQMFFVNSRPCGLPQIAKAFNEVYKSYNLSQSPFIFADIRLDTREYVTLFLPLY
jgi:DNA mismatch repair protein PMS2